MRCVVALVAFALPALLGCTGQHVVAGEERTKAEQYEATLPAWCSAICHTLQNCEEQDCACSGDVCDCGGGVDEDCAVDCLDDMSRWAQGSDECAAIGQRFKDCLDAAACSLLSGGNTCQTDEADQNACPRPGSPDPGSAPDADSSGGLNPPMNVPVPVTCQEGGGTGSAPGAEPGVAQLLCELEHLDCSDGQDRQVVCVTTSQGPTSCACRLDGVLTGAFDPGGNCPTLAQQNVGCGWSLQEM